MSLKAMQYEMTPLAKPSGKRINTKLTSNLLSEVGTATLLWHVINRHKYDLVVGGLILENVLLVLHFFTII